LDKVNWLHFQSTPKEVIWPPKFIFELHALVEKCHFGNFSERAGMAIPFKCGLQKRIIAFEKFFLIWVPMNI
jgi:hypothetical protein